MNKRLILVYFYTCIVTCLGQTVNVTNETLENYSSEELKQLLKDLTATKHVDYEKYKIISKVLLSHEHRLQLSDFMYSSMNSIGNNSIMKTKKDVFSTVLMLSKKAQNNTFFNDNFLYIDGDILVDKQSILGKRISRLIQTNSSRTKRKISRKYYADGSQSTSRWPQKLVPYYFDQTIDSSMKSTIISAIEHWSSQTCIKFESYSPIKHSSTHKFALTFTQVAFGCYSSVGYPDERLASLMNTTNVFLSKACRFAQVVHEIGHVIGFYHEMNRGDRDDHVIINWENINQLSSVGINFYKFESAIEPNNLNVHYDLASIMHYSSNAFSSNGSKTITAKDTRREFLMGNSVSLTYYDIKLACLAYNCSEFCNSIQNCLNDGYIGPNCTCVCPAGTQGLNCENFISSSKLSNRLDDLHLNCTFEQPSTCDWIQEAYRDEVDFLINNGKTLAQFYRGNTGPSLDRFQSISNFYLYFNTYYFKIMNESAWLVSPELTNTSPYYCVRFWFNMFASSGAAIGNLTLYLKEESNENLIILWSKSGTQSRSSFEWLQANVDVNTKSSSFRLIFEAKRVLSFMGDIALDDIEVSNHTCSPVTHSTLMMTSRMTTLASVTREWSQWSPCSITCNSNMSSDYATGTQIRQELCNGQPCGQTQTIECFTYIKCKPYYWSSWSTYTSCTQKCSSNNSIGFMRRTRSCLDSSHKQINLNDTLALCGHEYENQVECNSYPCPIWSSWTMFTPCCNGTQMRKRFCFNSSLFATCLGNDTEYGYCAKDECSLLRRSIHQQTILNSNNCGGIYELVNKADSLIVSSPNYPQNYPLNTQCSYIFKTLPSNKLSIQVLKMDIETNRFNLCPDSLEIRYYALGQIGPRYCGSFSAGSSNMSMIFISYSNMAMIYFRSDYLFSSKGFHALISIV